MEEPDSPLLTAETPRIFSIADSLREKIATDVIVHAYSNKKLDGSKSADELILSLVQQFPDSDIWYAAMMSPYHDVPVDQDIVLVECARRNLFSLITSFVTLMPMNESRKQAILDAPGRYGRPAIQHAVMRKQWHAASMLIRHGASLGLVGDQYGIVGNILDAVGVDPGTVNVLEHYDAKEGDRLATCITTIDSLYGEDWATHAEPLTPKEQTEVGTRPLWAPSKDQRTDHYMSAQSASSCAGSGRDFNSWSLARAHRNSSRLSVDAHQERSFSHQSLAHNSSYSSTIFRTSSISSAVGSISENGPFPKTKWPDSPRTAGRCSEPGSPTSPRAVSTPGGYHDYERNRKTSLLMAKWTIREVEGSASGTGPASSSERG